MKAVLARLAREPASLGGAVLAWVAVADPSPVVMAAATATVAWVIRLLSAPKQAVVEAEQRGRDAALADVSSLAD